MRGDQRGFGKLVFRQDIRVPPYQCPQTGSPFAHHCILSSRSMSEYGLIRSRGFCAFFFLGMGMNPRLISRFKLRLCRADLAILQPSLSDILKRTGPPFAAMSSDAPCGYSRPGGRVPAAPLRKAAGSAGFRHERNKGPGTPQLSQLVSVERRQTQRRANLVNHH